MNFYVSSGKLFTTDYVFYELYQVTNLILN